MGLYLAASRFSRGYSSVASFGGSDKFVTDTCGARSSASRARTRPSSCSEAPCSRPCPAAVRRRPQRSDSAAVLERLALENLFVVALDNTRSSFRYHHLFGRCCSPTWNEVSRTSSPSWDGPPPGARGERTLEDAIEYVSASGDTDTLARLVTANAFAYYRGGRVSTVERWLDAFDEPELLARHPGIAVIGTWLHALRGRADAAERWALAIEASEQRGAMPDGSPFDAWAAIVRALLCRSGIEQMRKMPSSRFAS